MPAAISENGAALFLTQGSPEWHTYETALGRPLQAHSMHRGEPGAWVRPDPTIAAAVTPPPSYKPHHHIPEPPPPPPTEAEKVRVGNLFQAFANELRAQTQPPQTSPATEGATDEERERAAALERLEQLKGQPLPPISSAAREAAGIPQKRDDKAWTTDDEPQKRKIG